MNEWRKNDIFLKRKTIQSGNKELSKFALLYLCASLMWLQAALSCAWVVLYKFVCSNLLLVSSSDLCSCQAAFISTNELWAPSTNANSFVVSKVNEGQIKRKTAQGTTHSSSQFFIDKFPLQKKKQKHTAAHMRPHLQRPHCLITDSLWKLAFRGLVGARRTWKVGRVPRKTNTIDGK